MKFTKNLKIIKKIYYKIYNLKNIIVLKYLNKINIILNTNQFFLEIKFLK